MDNLEEIFHKILEEKCGNDEAIQNPTEMTSQPSTSQGPADDLNSNFPFPSDQDKASDSVSQPENSSNPDNFEIREKIKDNTSSESTVLTSANQEINVRIMANQNDDLNSNEPKTANQDDAFNSNTHTTANQDDAFNSNTHTTANQDYTFNSNTHTTANQDDPSNQCINVSADRNQEHNSNLKELSNEEDCNISTLEIIGEEEDGDVCYTQCEILDKCELESSFQCPLIIAMTVLNKDSILRLEQDGCRVSKIDKSGHVTQTVPLDFEACDLAVTEEGDILLASYHEECIMKLKQDGTMSRFIKLTSGKKPMALDVDESSGDIWVACVEEGENCGYIASLKMYFRDGTLLQYVYYHDNTLSHYPMKISICPSNGDVAISETKVDEDREMMTVTVLNQWGTEKWSYPPDESFNTEDAEFDSMSNLLVSVPCDKGLHLVGEKGTLLRIIYQCDLVPQIIAIAMNGRMWIWCQDNVENGFEIRTVKYLDVE